MRTRSHGSFATILLMVPLLAVPMLAVFGIPQFAPVVASPIVDDARLSEDSRRLSPADLFAPLSEPGATAGQTRAASAQPWPPRGGHTQPELDRPAVTSPSGLPDQLPRRDRYAQIATEFSTRFAPQATPHALPSHPADRASDLYASRSTQPQPRDGLTSAMGRHVGAANSRNHAAAVSHAGRDVETDEAHGGIDDRSGVRARPAGYSAANAPITAASPASRPHPPDRQPLTWQQAVTRLNELNIRTFRLEPGAAPDQFVFTCSYAPAHAPRVVRRFEAEASEPLLAVEKVLAQLEEWRSQP